MRIETVRATLNEGERGYSAWITVPRAVGERLGGAGARLRWHVEGGTIACGLLPDGAAFRILVTRALRERAGIDGSRVVARLSRDTSELGMDLSEELREALAQDARGRAAFDALTPGRKRGVMSLVAARRTEAGRIERAVALVEALARGETDLKRLAGARSIVRRDP